MTCALGNCEGDGNLDNTSILTSIKKVLGIMEDDTSFDTDIIIHINSVFMILNQLGVGPSSGFTITSKSNVWGEFLPSDQQLELVKSYMYLKVRQLFDPPTVGAVMDSMQKLINEFEWRLNVEVDPIPKREEEIQNG